MKVIHGLHGLSPARKLRAVVIAAGACRTLVEPLSRQEDGSMSGFSYALLKRRIRPIRASAPQ